MGGACHPKSGHRHRRAGGQQQATFRQRAQYCLAIAVHYCHGACYGKTDRRH